MKNSNELDEIMREWGKKSREQVSSPTVDCLSSPQIIGFIDKSLDDAEMQKVESHLANCDYCILEVAEVFRAVAKRKKVLILPWRPMKGVELRKLLGESIDSNRATASHLPSQSVQYAIAANGAKKLMVSVFQENDKEKLVPFAVESGPEVDNEGQLVLTIAAPEESYEGKRVDLKLKLDENRILDLASPPIFNGTATIMLDMDLEAGLEIPLNMIKASIGKNDRYSDK